MKATHVIPNSFRNLSIAIILAFVINIPAQAQLSFTKLPVKNRATYVNAQSDTTAAKRIASANLLSVSLTFTDTTAVSVYVDYSKDGTTWANILTDSIVTSTASSAFDEWSIRDSDSDLIDNVAGWIRTRLLFNGAGNGKTGTHYYSVVYNYTR